MISLVKQKFDKIDDLQKFFCQRCAGGFFLVKIFPSSLVTNCNQNLISSITVHLGWFLYSIKTRKSSSGPKFAHQG